MELVFYIISKSIYKYQFKKSDPNDIYQYKCFYTLFLNAYRHLNKDSFAFSTCIYTLRGVSLSSTFLILAYCDFSKVLSTCYDTTLFPCKY